ncbi:MAG: hypothetical protein WA799_00535 [Nitrosotalea sp.]
MDDYSFLTPIISIIVAVGSLLFTGYQTLKFRGERKLLFRSWIGLAKPAIEILRYYTSQGIVPASEIKNKPLEVYVIKEVDYLLTVKNFGQIPATMASRYYWSNEKPERLSLDNSNFGQESVFMPNEERMIIFKIPYEICIKEWYLTLDLKYTSENSNDEKRYDFIAKILGGGFEIIDSWNEHSK